MTLTLPRPASRPTRARWSISSRRAGAQILGLVDDEEDLLSAGIGPLEEFAEVGEEALAAVRLDRQRERLGHFVAKLGGVEAGVGELRHAHALGAEAVGEGARQHGLSCPDLAGEEEDARVLEDRGPQGGKRVAVVRPEPEEARIGVLSERLRPQIVVGDPGDLRQGWSSPRPDSSTPQSPKICLIASITGFAGACSRVAVRGGSGFLRYFLTQAYCSQPFNGKSRSTDFHLGCPFCTSHPMLSTTILANCPTVSQSRRWKSKEMSTALTATVGTGLGCQA